jgi:hypothetical protein
MRIKLAVSAHTHHRASDKKGLETGRTDVEAATSLVPGEPGVATTVPQLSHFRSHRGCCSADSDFAYHTR